MVRRFFAFLLALSMLTLSSACFAESLTLDELLSQRAELDKAIAKVEEEEIVSKAIETLVAFWKNEIYSGNANYSKNGYLEIKWARVVYIRDEIDITGSDLFQNMNCYVEFFLLSDYFGTAPYYCHCGINECVAFMKDGSFEVVKNDPINVYRSRYYAIDFEPIIESISDRGSDFNQVFELLIE